MSQRLVQKVRTQASAVVQPGETVRHALPVTSGPYIAMFFGPLGTYFLKGRIVALTDAALYVMTGSAMLGKAKAVERRLPLGSVAASTGKGPAVSPFLSTLLIGQERMWVKRAFKEEAENLAAATAASDR